MESNGDRGQGMGTCPQQSVSPVQQQTRLTQHWEPDKRGCSSSVCTALRFRLGAGELIVCWGRASAQADLCTEQVGDVYSYTLTLLLLQQKKWTDSKHPREKKNNQRGLLTLRFSFFKTLSCKSSSLAAGQEQRTLCQPHACGLKARAMLSTCHLKNRACVVANQECVPSMGPATVSWATTAVKNATLKPPKSEVLIQKRCLFLSGEADHWNGCCCTALHFYKAHSTWGMDPFCWTVQADSDDILE